MAIVDITGTIEGLADLSASLTEIPPTITAAATGPTTVRVTFDKVMEDDANLSDPDSYTFAPLDESAVPVLANAVVPEGGGSPTFVDVTVTEMTDGADYDVITKPNIVDEGGIPVEESTQFVGQGQKPGLVSATAITRNKIRLVFDEPMDPNEGLLDPNSYTVTPQAPGVGQVFVNSVVVSPLGAETIDLTTSEMTDGGDYELAVDSSGPVRDAAFNPVDPAADTDLFVGIGEKPTLVRVEAIGENRVDLIFSEPMRDNADIRNVANYQWETIPDSPPDDISTVAVLAIEESTVKLVTTKQMPDVQYRVTVG